MAEYFSSLSTRERLLTIAAIIIGLILIAYIYLWEPKMRQLQQLRTQQLPQSEQTLAWVKQALGRAKTQGASGNKKIIEGPLLTIIEQTAEMAKVNTSIRRMQPSQNQDVKIWMDDVEFDRWLVWLDFLKRQNVFVSRTSIINKSPGLVDIRLTLSRS